MLKETSIASITLPVRTGSRRLAWQLAGATFAAALAVAWAGCAASARIPGIGLTGLIGRSEFERVLEAVVRIDVREMAFDQGTQRFTSGVGSGVIISGDGVIVTNAHVVTPQAVEILVTLADLESVRATLIGWDHWTDLAVLRLDMQEVRRRQLAFEYAEFGDSEKLTPGQTVYALGTPHGLTRTVTRGIISNSDRYFEASDGVRGYETGYFNTWLQTDAAINPGNSGGPLVNESGRVIGINSRTYLGAENLGFAIPAGTAREVVEKLLEHGEVVRSYIGIRPGALRDLEHFFSLAANTGVLVDHVDAGSPANRAGIRPGDVLLAIDGAPVDGRFPEQLPPIQNRIANVPVGSSLTLTLKRGDQELSLPVVTERLESHVGEEWAFEKWGMSVRKVSRAFARENRLEEAVGVIVIGTQPAFPAAQAGISRGDIITKVNSEEIDDLDNLKQIYGLFEVEPQSLLVEALRNRTVSFFVLKP